MSGAVDGAWACTVDTPMGEQSFTLTIVTHGDRFTGRAEGALGAMDIEEGTVEGDRLAWPMRVAKPMPVTLACAATVDGDRMEGDVAAGIFGRFALRGTRA